MTVAIENVARAKNEDSTDCRVSQSRAPVADDNTGHRKFRQPLKLSTFVWSQLFFLARWRVCFWIGRESEDKKERVKVGTVVGICEQFLGQKSCTPYRWTWRYKSFLVEIWFSSEKTVEEAWPYKTVSYRLSYDLFLDKVTAIQRRTSDPLISLQSVRGPTWSTSVPAVKRYDRRLARIAWRMDVLPGRSFPSFSLCSVELQRHNCIHVSSIAPHPMTFYSTVLYCTIILAFLSSIFYHMYTLPL